MKSDPPGLPGEPPSPSDPPSSSQGRPRPPQPRARASPEGTRKPANPRGDEVYDLGSSEDAIYDLGTTQGEESAEEERLRAIQEIVALTGERDARGDEAIPEHSVELSIDTEADDLEKQRAIQEVVRLAPPERADMGTKAPEPVKPIPLPAGEVASELVKAQVLKEVVESAARFTLSVRLAKQMQSYRARPIVLAALAIPCLLLGVYTFIARPEWVFGPNPARLAPDQREGHLRFAMFLLAQRLHAYREANGGQLPAALADVGEEWPGIEYRNVDGSMFELRGKDPSTPLLVYRSYDDPTTFAGGSRQFLRQQVP